MKISEDIKLNIEKKWIFVYEYISINELFLTIKKDFLLIIWKFHIPIFVIILIISVWLLLNNFAFELQYWNITYWSSSDTPIIHSVFFIIKWLMILYSFIFIFIFSKFLLRTYYFLLISKVVLTDKWLIIWNKIFEYWDKIKQKTLKKYEKMFDEYLFSNSNLANNINYLNSNINSIISKHSKVLEDLNKNNNKNDNSINLLFIIYVIAFFIFVISIKLFYYIWYFIWFLFFWFIYFILKFFLKYKYSVEDEIRLLLLKLDEIFFTISNLWEEIKKDFDKFNSWNIFNLEKVVSKKFDTFYLSVSSSFKIKNNLIKILETTNYRNLINFSILSLYIKEKYNSPLNNIIYVLDKTIIKIKTQIKDNLNVIDNSVDKVWIEKINERNLVLKNQLLLSQNNIDRLKKLLIN